MSNSLWVKYAGDWKKSLQEDWRNVEWIKKLKKMCTNGIHTQHDNWAMAKSILKRSRKDSMVEPGNSFKMILN